MKIFRAELTDLDIKGIKEVINDEVGLFFYFFKDKIY